jgi:hypothetical protein
MGSLRVCSTGSHTASQPTLRGLVDSDMIYAAIGCILRCPSAGAGCDEFVGSIAVSWQPGSIRDPWRPAAAAAAARMRSPWRPCRGRWSSAASSGRKLRLALPSARAGWCAAGRASCWGSVALSALGGASVSVGRARCRSRSRLRRLCCLRLRLCRLRRRLCRHFRRCGLLSRLRLVRFIAVAAAFA